jgi:hypothetical protein
MEELTEIETLVLDIYEAAIYENQGSSYDEIINITADLAYVDVNVANHIVQEFCGGRTYFNSSKLMPQT